MEKIDKAIEILQAFKEGKIIETSYDGNNWSKCVNEEMILKIIAYDGYQNIRIKPQPTYRPYANAEEFMKASKEHGPYIYDKRTYTYRFISEFDDKAIAFLIPGSTGKAEQRVYEYEYLLGKNSTLIWSDGTPCGILE